MGKITTHILDTALGEPAAGVQVELACIEGETARAIATGETNLDGRVMDWTGGLEIKPGHYRVTFLTGDYFATTKSETFFPHVTIDFTVTDADAHYHVPLLLSPFGYSTYRGS